MGEPTLSIERAYFEERKRELLASAEGKFALIVGREVLGTFDSPGSAYEAGISRVGNVPMLIAEIRRDDRVDQVPALSLGLIHAGLS